MPAPPSTASLLESAHRLYGVGLSAQALEKLSLVSECDRQGRDFLLLYGACLARTRRRDEAASTFGRLLEINPECFEALTWMAILCKDPRNMEASFEYARRAIGARPLDAAGYGVLGDCYLAASRPDEAIEALGRAVDFAPDMAEHRHNLALAFLMAHRHGEAIVQLRQGMALAPQDPQSYLVLASTYSLYGMAGQAVACLSEGLAQMPNSPALHSAIAGAFSMIRNDAAAERHHRRALELSPESRSGFGSWLMNQGRFEEAQEVFQAMVRSGQDTPFAYYGLTQSRKGEDATALEAMQGMVEAGGLRPRSEMFLHYALGRSEEGRKDHASAMAHYDEANRLAQAVHHRGRPIDPADFAKEHIGVRRLYEGLRDAAPAGDPTDAPILIVGMIRSGTTLLDQIVSSHPGVSSGGELRFWIEETLRLVALGTVCPVDALQNLSEEYVAYARLLAGSESRFTDKMPLNFAYLGVMNLAMPNARFLHIRRHPVDTCLSIWTTYFGQGALFAYDKPNIVAYYREYRKAMAHWREQLPSDRLLELDYEDLIADPEPTIRRVIDFCGLPWDDACLHHDQNASAINTPSRWQARQPIYRTSVERWRQYELWLGEFRELLEEA